VANERGRSENFKTDTCRLGFDRWLFTPEKKVVGNGPNKGKEFEEYGATLIFSNSISRVPFDKAVMAACIDAKWGTEQEIINLVKTDMIRLPFLKGDGKEARNKKDGQLHPGMGPDVWFIRTNTRQAPVVRWKDVNMQATKDEVYSGCYGFAVLNAYTWTGDTGKGVSFGLNYFQKKTEGEKLFTGGQGGVDPSDYYEKIADEGDAPQETKTGAGAGGLFG